MLFAGAMWVDDDGDDDDCDGMMTLMMVVMMAILRVVLRAVAVHIWFLMITVGDIDQ